MNSIGGEYRQIGGDFKVVHHSEYLASLVAEGRLHAVAMPSSVTYHDPCYLGRHNGVYDAPRKLLRILTNDFVELDRTRENSFCCGAGGAQFWKEEEAGTEKISENRSREVGQRLGSRNETKVLAVGCPFCKGMLNSATTEGDSAEFAVKDIAELLLESLQAKSGEIASNAQVASAPKDSQEPRALPAEMVPNLMVGRFEEIETTSSPASTAPQPDAPISPDSPNERKKWLPRSSASGSKPA
jgi:hypothetical protein